MIALVWSVRWRTALARRRSFALGIVVPAAVATLIATGGAGGPFAASALPVLIVGYSAIRAAFTLVSDCRRGLTARVARAGISPASYLLQRAAAHATVDTLQLAPALLIAGAAGDASLGQVALTVGALLGATWICGLIGIAVAAATPTPEEAGLLAGLGALLLVHASGALRSFADGSVGAGLETLSPFRFLHEAMLDMIVGAPVDGAWSFVAWAALLPALVVLLAPRPLTLPAYSPHWEGQD